MLIEFYEMTTNDWNDIKEWCDDNLVSGYILGRFHIFLEDEEMAMAFKLRWI